MYCVKCGKEVRSEDAFCASCGAAIKQTQQEPHELQQLNVIKKCVNSSGGKTGKKEITLMAKKIIFFLVVLLVFFITDAGVFDVFGYGVLTMEEVVQRSINMKDIMGENTMMLELSPYLMYIGILCYFLAAVIVFFKREKVSILFAFIGFMCNVPIIYFVVDGVCTLGDGFSMDFFDMMKYFTKDFYLYLGMNLAVVCIALYFFSGVSSTKKKIREYAVPALQPKKEVPGEWCCKKCGERNESFMKKCNLCGALREKM